MTDQEVKKIIEQLQQWHDNNVNRLKKTGNSKENIIIQGPSGDPIPLNKEQSKGVKNGLLIAVDIIGKFPVTITETKDEEEE